MFKRIKRLGEVRRVESIKACSSDITHSSTHALTLIRMSSIDTMTVIEHQEVSKVRNMPQEPIEIRAQVSPGIRLMSKDSSTLLGPAILEERPDGDEDLADGRYSEPLKSYQLPLPDLKRAQALHTIRQSLPRDLSRSSSPDPAVGNSNVDRIALRDFPSTHLQDDSCGASENTIATEELARPADLPALDPPATQPRQFLEGKSWSFKAIFITITCSAQFLGQAQFGMVVIPLIEIGEYLGTTSPGELSWMAASNGYAEFPLHSPLKPH